MGNEEGVITMRSDVQRVKGVLEQMAQEVPGFIHSAVVDMEMADALAQYPENGNPALHDIDLNKTAALYSDVVRVHMKNVQCLGGEGTLGATQDMFIATDRFYMIMRPMPDILCYQCLLVRRNDNLGIARSVLRRYSETIENLIRG